MYQQSWHYNDLRMIDPADAEDPSKDIIALYVRDSNEDLGLRFDVLDMEVLDQQEIYIGLDYKPSGLEFYSTKTKVRIPSEVQWDILLKIPATGDIEVSDSQGNLITGIKARVYRDPSLDMISIDLSKQNLLPESSPIKLEVVTTNIFSSQVIDRVGPVNSRTLPPSPAQVAFIFWNVFEPYSPASALKSWDGAHTGPMSERHGLRHLLDSTEQNGIPVTLLDLGDPISLSALDYLGVSNQPENFSSGGYLGVSRGVGNCIFENVSVNGYAKYRNRQENNPVPLEIRKEIIHAALDRKLLLIGSDFRDSIWGNPLAASSIFRYIRDHPWIITRNFLELNKQLSGFAEKCKHESEPTVQVDQRALDAYQHAYNTTPENILRELARQTYEVIANPATPEASSIAQNYFWQLGHILSAAYWYEKPYSISSCSIDLDWDGQEECILASKNMYLTFELTGGYLAFSFFLDERGVHQITAPMSEVVIGFGDPITYEAANGAYADPALIPGSAVNINEIHELYTYNIGTDFIELSSKELGISKRFQVKEDRIQIEWETTQDVSYVIPISLDPWLRFESDWGDRYIRQNLDDPWIWGIKNDIAIRILSSIGYQIDAFVDSIGYIGQAEDPNYEYPRGHYLPFPYSIVTVPPSKAAHIEIEILSP